MAVPAGGYLICALVPELVVSKSLAVTFKVTGMNATFLSFVIGNIPCEKSLTSEEQKIIEKKVTEILRAKGLATDTVEINADHRHP